jgi:membrane-bound metal-dependent hydrolase YbcI (DUF457 family)
VIALTHFVFGLSLAYILDKRLVTASAFALVPDLDKTFTFLYPFTSGGIMHSLIAATVFTLLVYIYTEDRVSAESCALGYIVSGLGLDLLTSSGVPVFFPLLGKISVSIASTDAITFNLAIIILSLILMFGKKHGMLSIDFANKL